jgi:hypothetical protein
MHPFPSHSRSVPGGDREASSRRRIEVPHDQPTKLAEEYPIQISMIIIVRIKKIGAVRLIRFTENCLI